MTPQNEPRTGQADYNADYTPTPALPFSVPSRTETDITDVTDNKHFLAAVFAHRPEGALVIVSGGTGDPNRGPDRGPMFTAKDADQTPLNPDWNNYFCISSHFLNKNGEVKRSKATFAALHCITLDDVGTKVPLERITLAPTWELETSPGNYQIGYVLAPPIKNADEAERFYDALAKAGLTDKGATGAATRLMRLPVGINGKAAYRDAQGQPFRCRLHHWKPERRFTEGEIADGLGLKREPAERASGDAVYLPKQDKNPVIEALGALGLYKKPLGTGKHDITCPWVHEHTSGDDDGTAYFEPDDNYPLGGFKCLHSHGDQYHISHLLDYLGISPAAAKHQPVLRVFAGELSRVVDQAEQLLAQGGRHFQAGGQIVTITTSPETGETAISPVSAPALTLHLAQAATWEHYDKRAKACVGIDPPARHVAILHDKQQYQHLPPLLGLARQPYLDRSGRIITKSGYDTPSQMFGIFDPNDFNLPEAPTREHARAALAKLLTLVDEVVFAEEYDRAAAMALFLTAAARPGLRTAPMFHVSAPVRGSGKSFLCKLAGAIATPATAAPLSFPKTEEEMQKVLLAVLLRAPAVIEFDDLNSDLSPYSALKTAITEEAITGRILGVSKDATVSTRTLLLSSGNNVGPVGDMTRRVIPIHLDPRCETPTTRTYQHPHLLTELRNQRGAVVSACLTIMSAWKAAGEPTENVPNVASFEVWNGYCRQALLWLGQPDPCTRLFEGMANDPDAEQLRHFMEALATFGQRAFMVRDLAEAHVTTPLGQCVAEIAGESQGFINRRMLGRWLKRHEGRIIGDRRLVPENRGLNASAWRVSSVTAVSSGSSVTAVSSVSVRDGTENGSEKTLPPWVTRESSLSIPTAH